MAMPFATTTLATTLAAATGKMVPPNRIPHPNISWHDINYTRTWHNLETDVCCCGEAGAAVVR